ncbi:MAG TPA: diguanylate cyclase [Gaiellaceae bacterium]|nr:diguanylate cyclase [Gaiellaceae bacterium]
MGSFKLRLVTYFILLALVPLLAASWAFSEVSTRGEVGNADSRLNAALRVAINDHAGRVDDLAAVAKSLANATSVQRAFQLHNRSALVGLAREADQRVAFYSHGNRIAGDAPPGFRVTRSSFVESPTSGRRIGRIIVWLALDRTLLAELRHDVGLSDPDWLLLARGGKVVAGPSGAVGAPVVPLPEPDYLDLGGTRYRGVSAPFVETKPPLLLVALTPKSTIDDAVSALRERFLLFALLALGVVGLLAWLLGRTIVRSLRELADAAGAVSRGQFGQRVPVRGRDEFANLGRAFNEMSGQLAAERGRVQDAVDRFGKALAATHDPFTLLNVIVESTVEATGAAGGRLVVDGEEQARAGEPDEGDTPLVIPLGPEGGEEAMLLLTPAGADFGDQSRELALWLGSQAAIALENVRLHRLVARQASTDGLTELANRREFEDSLATEISRAERFGGSLALILADLDDFKQVNDRFGHQAGDEVLRQFAAIVRETVRDIDVAARYGGEEFAILLPQTDIEGAERLAERLRRAVETSPMAHGQGFPVIVTSSFGVASFPDADSAARLFRAADEALYRAKRAGKNCVVSADAKGPVRARH